MNRDSDITKNILLRLLLESDSEEGSQSGDRHLTDSNPSDLSHPSASSQRDREPTSPGLNQSDLDSLAQSDQDFFEYPIGADPNDVSNPGDLPAVQTHFEALLKRRLTQEIAQHPPLFPWEKGVQDYPDGLNSEAGAASVWLDHLKNLQVPDDLPEEVLAELLNQCQRVAEQTLQIGRRLVSAVESLFPDQSQTLDYIAGLVSRPAYRSTQAQTLERVDYRTASPQQQVALVMLAAQNIFEALSLTVSATTPVTTRTWLTMAGPLTITATYLNARQLEVRAHLPQAGTLVLTGAGQEMGADRSTAGDLILPLEEPQAQTPYSLEVSLGEHPTAPLCFQILVEAS
jgi:hypothetical protein